MDLHHPIHITIPGSADDPRHPLLDLPGIVVHRVPMLHPDDVTMLDGIPVTTVARTLIDCADDLPREELRTMFESGRRRGLVDLEALRASRGRVEWRPSLAVIDELIDELAEEHVP